MRDGSRVFGRLRAIGAAAGSAATVAFLWGAATVALTSSAAAADRWVAGYLVGYEHDLQPETSFDFTSLTHLVIGRYVPKSDGTLNKSCDWDASRCPIWAKRMGGRAHAAGRKALLFLGGAGARFGFVGAAAPAKRPAFVAAIAKAVKDLDFDGVDVDWEPVESRDVTNLLALLADLRAAMPTKLITMPVGFTNMNFPTDGIGWVKSAARYLDQINIMTYEMDGNWGWTKTWHASALDGATSELPTSVKVSVASYRSLGIPASKLGLGFGFYGQCWKGGVTAPRKAVGSSSIVGSITYADILDNYYRSSAYHYDMAAHVPYLGSSFGLGPLDCTYISYEDPRSIAAKVAFAKSQGLGGGIIWTVSEGWRASTGTNDPLTAVGQLLK